MTSNIGARLITDKKVSFGFVESDTATDDIAVVKDKVMAQLKEAFRPEFLNRVDDIIVFNKLTKEEIKMITKGMLKNLSERLKGLQINIEFTDPVITKLSETGFDSSYGARPLRRKIQNEIEDILSEKILDGSIKQGQNIKCSIKEGKYEFTTI
jgi:ATP-dependent Clp protease ATP-binding subunit ClpC